MSNAEGSIEKLYELNERVLCSHTDNLYYDAKVVDVETTEAGVRIYKIHYKGWNVRFDEEFEDSQARFRIRPFTEEAYEKAKEELKAAREMARNTQKKSHKGSKSGSHKRKSLPGRVPAATGTPKRGRGRPSLSSISTKSSNEERAKSAQLESPIVKPNALNDGGSISPTESDSVYSPDADRPFYDFASTTLPSRIKKILREDLIRTLEGTTFVKVPARWSISRILSEYAKEIRNTDAQYGEELAHCNPVWKAAGQAMDECCNNIKDTFDVFIGTELLTEREHERHSRLINSGIITTRRAMFGVHSGKLRACDVYGFVHLLRLLVFSHDHPRALGNVSEEVVDAFKGTHLMLAMYLSVNVDRFLDISQDYVRHLF